MSMTLDEFLPDNLGQYARASSIIIIILLYIIIAHHKLIAGVQCRDNLVKTVRELLAGYHDEAKPWKYLRVVLLFRPTTRYVGLFCKMVHNGHPYLVSLLFHES